MTLHKTCKQIETSEIGRPGFVFEPDGDEDELEETMATPNQQIIDEFNRRRDTLRRAIEEMTHRETERILREGVNRYALNMTETTT